MSVSAGAAADRLEAVLHQDPGSRGLASIFPKTKGGLRNAADSLSQSRCVAIIVGFFIKSQGKQENDGLIGAVSLAKVLVGIGKAVMFVTDSPNEHGLKTAISHAGFDRIPPVMLFPMHLDQEKRQGFVAEWLQTNMVDHVVSIERPGRAADSKYYSMRAIDMSDITAEADEVFVYVHQCREHNPEDPIGRITLIGIGDGGNECGTGNVRDLVRTHVPHGEAIACHVESDHLILSGVSDWGGIALAFATISAFDREVAENRAELSKYKGFLPSPDSYESILARLDEAGIIDGVVGKPNQSVDGLSIETHRRIVQEMRAIFMQIAAK